MHFLNLGVKCFLRHNFGSRHARRSSKGSIDAGDRLVSNKSLNQNVFLIEPRRLAASVEGLNKSLAIAAGEL